MSSPFAACSPVQRAYRYRFYPTAEQRLSFEAHFGAARWVWNRALEFRAKAYRRRGESVTGVDFSRLLTRLKRTARHGWLRDTPSTVLTQKLRDQDRAFANFFAGRAKYPRFRKRRTAQSIRFQLDQRCIQRTFDANDRRLVLPGLGPLRLRWSHRPRCSDCTDAPGCPGCPKPKMVTVKRDAAGRWFVSFMVEEALRAAGPALNPVVGVDLGLKDLLTDSGGGRVAPLRALQRRLRGLRRAQRVLSRRRRGSGRWHELVRQIAYKAEWAGRVHVQVDPWFPSTKRCSACHAVREDLTLADRRWRCWGCGTGHDRDVNAARNLAQEGLRLLNEQRPRGLGRSMRVEGGPSGGVPAQAVNEPAPGETRTDSTRLKRYGTAEAA